MDDLDFEQLLGLKIYTFYFFDYSDSQNLSKFRICPIVTE